MKKIALLSFLILTFLFQAKSQNWVWTKKAIVKKSPTNRETMIHTQNGQVVMAGSRGYSYYSAWTLPSGTIDTSGSYLKVFDTTGVSILSKEWALPFYIQKLVEGNAGNFYFCGFYTGSFNIDGIHLQSKGSSDAMIGSMTSNGSIQWIRTMGGSKAEAYFDIIYNNFNGNLYTSGFVSDTVSFDGTYFTSGEQSGIITKYFADGNVSSYKLFDRVPGRQNSKEVVWEIADDKQGNLYALIQQDGYSWSGPDTVNAPYIGTYVYRLNNNLDSVWTKYIIGPGCYYGYSVGGLEVANGSDPYIMSYCRSKYGGNGSLTRLNASNGKIAWQLPNHDGSYQSLFIRDKTVYVTGNEGANGCPCPSSTDGYFVIKIIDHNNITIGETRIDNVYIPKITCSGSGSIYVYSFFTRRTCQYGPDNLTADSTQSFNGGYYNYSSEALSKLTSVSCKPVIATVRDAYPEIGFYYNLCPGSTCKLSVSPAVGSFLWNNGGTDSTLQVSSAGNYSCMNTQPSGCVAYSLPQSIQMEIDTGLAHITLASFDNTSGKYFTLVAQTGYDYSQRIKELKLFRKEGNDNILVASDTVSGYYNPLVDNSSGVAPGSRNYYVTTIGRCGTESGPSAVQNTIYVKSDTLSDGRIRLTWNKYNRMQGSSYKILRGESPSSMLSIYSTTDTTFIISDSFHYYFQVESAWYSHQYYNGNFYSGARSNILGPDANVIGTGPEIVLDNHILLYPNPSFGTVTVNYETHSMKDGGRLIVMAADGKILKDKIVSEKNIVEHIDFTNDPAGIYYIELQLENERLVKRIVKN